MNYRRRAFLVGGLYFCFGAMERATWPNLLPTIGDDFGVSATAVAWTVIAFALGMAGSTLTAGRLGDLLGHRRLAIGGFTAEAVLLALAAISPFLWLIFVFRFLQGFAAAAALNNVTAIVVGAFPPERRGRVIGSVSGLAAFGLMMGPLYGGFIAQWLDWRWAIGGIAAYTMAQAVVTAVLLRPQEPRGSAGRLRDLNWAGAIGLLLVMVALLVSAQLIRGADTRVIGGVLLAAAAGGAVLTVRLEQRAAMPILGLGLFKRWDFSAASIALVWFSLAFGAVNLLFPYYFQQGLGWTVAGSGVMLIALNVVQPWGSPLSGLVADRIGARRVLVAGGILGVLSLFLAGTLGEAPAMWRVILPLVLFGSAISLFMPPASKLIFSEVPPTALASAAAMATSGRYIGQSLGAALGTALLAVRGESSVAEAFGSAMSVIGVLLLAGMLALLVARPLVSVALRRWAVHKT